MPFYLDVKCCALVEDVMEVVVVELRPQERITVHWVIK